MSIGSFALLQTAGSIEMARSREPGLLKIAPRRFTPGEQANTFKLSGYIQVAPDVNTQWRLGEIRYIGTGHDQIGFPP